MREKHQKNAILGIWIKTTIYDNITEKLFKLMEQIVERLADLENKSR